MQAGSNGGPLGKKIATAGAILFSRPALSAVAEKIELFSRTLQSKGIDTSLPDQIKSVSSVLPQNGAIVFDVGGNKGFWTREMLKQNGTRIAQVHCFEPAAVNIAEIRKIGDKRVTLHPFAAGSSSGERQFFSDFAGSGIASFFKRDTPDAPPMPIVETVMMRRLDDVIDELGITRIDLLKMDIEGAEMEALQGLARSFDKGMIAAFTFEIGSVNITSRTYLADFFDFGMKHGFDIFRFTVGGGLHRLAQYRVSQECFATTNYLAVHKRA